MMRLLLRSGLVLFIALTATMSCGKKKKKDWQCACSVSDTTNTMVTNASKFIERHTKSQADTACSNYGTRMSSPYPASSFSCSVK